MGGFLTRLATYHVPSENVRRPHSTKFSQNRWVMHSITMTHVNSWVSLRPVNEVVRKNIHEGHPNDFPLKKI